MEIVPFRESSMPSRSKKSGGGSVGRFTMESMSSDTEAVVSTTLYKDVMILSKMR